MAANYTLQFYRKEAPVASKAEAIAKIKAVIAASDFSATAPIQDGTPVLVRYNKANGEIGSLIGLAIANGKTCSIIDADADEQAAKQLVAGLGTVPEEKTDGTGTAVNLNIALKKVERDTANGTPEKLQIVDKADNTKVLADLDITDLIVDGMLESAELVKDPKGQAAGTYVHLKFNTDAGGKEIYINVTSLIDVYNAGNGLAFDEGSRNFSVKVKDGDKILTVDANGVATTVVLRYLDTDTDKKIQLLGNGDAVISEIPVSDMIIDGQLIKDAHYDADKKAIVITVTKTDKTDTTFEIPVSDLFKFYTAGAGINFKENADKSNEISVKLKGDKVLAVDAAGLVASVGLVYDTTKELIELTGLNGQVIAQIDASQFIVQGIIKSVELVDQDAAGTAGKFIKITWTVDGKDQEMYLNVADLIHVYTAGKGIEIENNTVINAKLSDSTDKYLTLEDDGIKLSGIDAAIKAAVDKLQNGITAGDGIDVTAGETKTISARISTEAGNALELDAKKALFVSNIIDGGTFD